MADPQISFSSHAGHVLFPRSPHDLTTLTQCPACFEPLSGRVCQKCALDLNHPAAGELADTSAAIAELLDERLNIIGQMRFETNEAREQARLAAAAVPAAVAPAAVMPAAVAPSFVAEPAVAAPAVVAPAFAAPAPPPPPPAAPAATPVAASTPDVAPRRTSSIQVILLIAGVALVSLAAVFFLIYAFVNFGIEWRSAIIATITVATFTIASLLRRRNYTATAEGIAVFAVVLVYLDAYAVRANNLFGSETSDPQVYWGITLLGSAVGFFAWRRLSSLRVASVAGFAAVGPGAAVLVYGLAEQLDQPVRIFLSFAAMAVTGLAHPLAARRAGVQRAASAGVPERVIVLSLASLAIVVAFGSAFFIDVSFWGATFALVATAIIGAAHTSLALSHNSRTLRSVAGFGHGFAAIGAVAAASALVPTIFQSPEPAFAIIVPSAVAVAVALALDTLRVRLKALPAQSAARSLARSATIAAIVVASIGAIIPAVVATILTVTTVMDATVIRPWTLALGERLTIASIQSASAVAAVAIIAALLIGFSAASATLRSRRIALVATTGFAVTVAVPLLSFMWAITAGWFLIAVIGLALVVLGTKRLPISIGMRLTLAAATLVATSVGYLSSWASIDAWLAGSVITIVLVLAARLAIPTSAPQGRAGLLALSIVVGLIAAIAIAQQLTIDTRLTADINNSVRFVNIFAVILVLLSSLPRAVGLSTADRRTIFWIAVPIAIGTSFFAWATPTSDTLILAEYGTSIVVSSVLLVALLAWVVLRAHSALRAERIVASIALAPVAFWVVDGVARAIGETAFINISAAASALLVAAGALAVSLLRPTGTPRWARELGIALVTVPAIALAVIGNHEQTWLVLILAGVTALLLSISADGLFGSASGRKYVGWIALALATAGLWWRLTTDTVAEIEPYVLPLAGALLAIALLVWRSQRRAPADRGNSAAPFIALGGLLVGILPIALAASEGALTRAIVIAVVSATLLLGGSFLRGVTRLQPYIDAAATAGALGILAVTIGRVTLSIPLSDVRVDIWLAGTFVVLFAAAIGQTAMRTPSTLRSIIGQTLAGIALAVAVAIEVLALTTVGQTFIDLSQLRVLVWIILFAVIAVVSLTVDRGPFRVVVGWLAVTAVALLLTAALAVGTLTIVQAAGLMVLIALGSSVTALLVTLRTASRTSRIMRESGLAVLALLSLTLLPFSDSDAAWLVLEIAAVVALLIAVSPDGLFGSSSPRKYLGWLALALAAGGLWWRLSGTGVDDVEPYVLPLAGALLLIALLAWRARGALADGAGAAPLIALGGLLIAILPLGLNAATGSVVRPIVVGAVSAVLLLIGSLVVGSTRLRPYLDVAATAGAVGVLVVAIGRSWFITAETGSPNSALDAWLAASLIVLLIAAFGQARQRVENHPERRSVIAQTLGILALTVVLVFEIAAFDNSAIGFTRAIATVLLFSSLHVIALAIDRSPLSRLVGWIAFGMGIIAAAFGLATGAFDEIEFASVPLALALIAGGLLHLQRSPAARSWPHLGPGLLLLLVPSFVATFDDRVLWRIAAIAVVAIAATVAGLVGRLQAPFIIGAVVTIVHTITTFAPQLRELYELNSWLVWIVIGTLGGTLLIVLAARFEKSINTARTTLRRVGELR